MEVKNCHKCGKIFSYLSGRCICPNCVREEEELFRTVREYIRENKNIGVNEVADEFEIEVGMIYDWIREGRLLIPKGSVITLVCDRCGVEIQSGRLCMKCYQEWTGNLEINNSKEKSKKENPPELQKKSAKIRFLKN